MKGINTMISSNPKPAEEEELIPCLPNEIAMNCLARVPRWHHRALSQVSKPIRSLLHSHVFYNLHSAIHGKQPFLYLHLHSAYFPSQWWAFSLASPSPCTTIEPFPIPLLPSPTYQPAYAILGHHIYVIGGHLNCIISRQVWIMDCRFNRWREGPSMVIPRMGASTAVMDGKIYVMGGHDQEPLPNNWAEVLDPAVGRWVKADYNCFESRENRVWFEVGERVVTCDGRRVEKLWLGRNGWGCFEDGFFYKLNYPAMLTGQESVAGVEVVDGLLELPGWNPPDTNRRPKQLAGSIANGSLFVVWIDYWNREYKLWCSELEVNKSKRDHADYYNRHWEVSATPKWSHKVLFCSEQFKMAGSLVVDGL
ncbi:hypothetical protein PIB30_002328 [Stylosanthes scabra]|uniref:F-box domain-containing protein n=1 Tax=Stylosanthes scabra TaxID=79078 RepID=A0ABU6U398_9FABA|nr:hypothetical protein [Stylosanthes scabra]